MKKQGCLNTLLVLYTYFLVTKLRPSTFSNGSHVSGYKWGLHTLLVSSVYSSYKERGGPFPGMPHYKASRWVRCKFGRSLQAGYVSESVQEQQGPRPQPGSCTREQLSPMPLQPSQLLLYNFSLLPRHTFFCTEKAAVS